VSPTLYHANSLCGTGGTKDKQGQRKVPTKQHNTDVGRCWAALDGMEWFQRR
jgi:hypothetical protein